MLNHTHSHTILIICITHLLCIFFALCFVFVSAWAVVSDTGLSVLWNTFSFSTFIFHCFYVTCVL